MNKYLTLVLPGISILFASSALAGEYYGLARVVDGETLVVGERSLRLGGLDAWELGQTCPDETGTPFLCGEEATTFLKSMVEGKEVYCTVYKHPTRGERVTTCYREGRDLAEELVQNGWAMAHGAVSQRYVGQEKAARMGHRGGWRGLPAHPPTPPATWKLKPTP